MWIVITSYSIHYTKLYEKKTHYEKARHKKSRDNGMHGGNNGHYKSQKTSKREK